MTKNKRARQVDFTTGPILKPMLLFSFPVLFGNIFSAFYNVVDSIVVGQFVGSSALAAVNTSFAISMICTAVYSGFGMGCAVLVGQLYGARNYDKLNKAIATALLGAVIVGGVMSIVGVLISRPSLILINTPQEILTQADIYLKITLCGCASQLLYFMGSGMIRALGDSRYPMYFLVFCALVNIILDLVFVIVFNMGCAGVALATVIAQFLSAVLVVIRIIKGKYGIRITIKDLRIDMEMLKRIMKVGVPRAIQQLADSIGLLIIQSFANSFGTDFVAVNGVVQKVDTFAMLPIRSVAETIIMFNAQNLGAGKYERAQSGNRKIMVLVLSIGLGIGIFLFMVSQYIFKIFINPADPSYESILAMGGECVRILAFFYSVYALQQALISIMNGIGTTLPVMVIGLCCIIIRVPLTYYLSMVLHQYRNLFWATNIHNTLFMLGILLYYRLGGWRKVTRLNG